MKTLGYLGLGVMGYGMTGNLIDKSGCDIYGYDPVPALRERFAARERFQRVAAHYNYFAQRGFAKKLHIRRQVKQQVVVLADTPLLVHGYYRSYHISTSMFAPSGVYL